MATVAPIDGTMVSAANESDSEGGTMVGTMFSTMVGTIVGAESVEVRWQWWHKHGYRNYNDVMNRRIEEAFQCGESHIRMKAGKTGSTPMEIFFVDMIQYDPITHNKRDVQRLGPDTCYMKMMRHIRAFLRSLETGRSQRLVFAEYDRKRQILLKGADSEIATDLYAKDTIFAFIVRSTPFLIITTGIVVMNTLWLGFSADSNEAETIAESEPIFQIGENLFCILFTLELLIRFMAYKDRRSCWKDAWFIFDFGLVSLMIFETWVLWIYFEVTKSDSPGGGGLKTMSVLRMIRLLRLTRLGRIAKALRVIPEVMTIIKGILLAVRSVFFTTLLLLVLMFLFAVILKQQAEGPVLKDMFPTVKTSMWILLLQGIFLDDLSGCLNEMEKESEVLTGVFIVFIGISTFTILNMLIGIICEVVTQVSRSEKEESAIQFLRNEVVGILEAHDKDDDRHIHKEEFDLLLQNPDMHWTLTRFGVNVGDLESMKDVLFEEHMRKKPPSTRICPINGSPTATVTNVDAMVDAVLDRCDTASPLYRQASPPDASPIPVEKEKQKISFAIFLQHVMRLRGGNGASVHDIVDLRDYMKWRLDSIEERARSSVGSSESSDADPGCSQPPPWAISIMKELKELKEAQEDAKHQPPPWASHLISQLQDLQQSNRRPQSADRLRSAAALENPTSPTVADPQTVT